MVVKRGLLHWEDRGLRMFENRIMRGRFGPETIENKGMSGENFKMRKFIA